MFTYRESLSTVEQLDDPSYTALRLKIPSAGLSDAMNFTIEGFDLVAKTIQILKEEEQQTLGGRDQI